MSRGRTFWQNNPQTPPPKYKQRRGSRDDDKHKTITGNIQTSTPQSPPFIHFSPSLSVIDLAEILVWTTCLLEDLLFQPLHVTQGQNLYLQLENSSQENEQMLSALHISEKNVSLAISPFNSQNPSIKL